MKLWFTAHGINMLIKLGMFLAGMLGMYVLMLMQAWCFEQHTLWSEALGSMILLAAATAVYWVIQPDK